MEPTIYATEEHGIDHEKIDQDALTVLEKLHEAGHTAYLVGGGVRDLLTGSNPKDFDISTSAQPEEIKRIFRRRCILVGRRFRLAHVRFGKKIIEVSTFRAGDTTDSDLIVHDNTWGTPEQDVLRRDFTINGLFYDSQNRSVIDYVGGMEDIRNHLMRSIGEPAVRYRQDPVRMIRLLKFKARFGFNVREEEESALTECKEDILKSAPARLLEEMLRMLESGASEPFFRLMEENDILKLLLPDISAFIRSEGGEVVYDYLAALDKLHKQQPNPYDRGVLCACLFFPLFERNIQNEFLSQDKLPHLGEVNESCYGLLREVMGEVFCTFPKRLRALCANILTTQYRLTPFTEKRKRSLWILRNKDIRYSLIFLYIRSQVNPSLKRVYAEWHHLYYSNPAPKRRKRRRKRLVKKS